MVQHLIHIRGRCITWRLILAALFAALGMSLGELQPAYAQTPVNCVDTATPGVPQAEYDTLVAFYTSANRSGWTNSTNWNTATAVGTWHGVTVGSGHVVELSLAFNNLSGSIPDLSAFTYLQILDLTYNELRGSIPVLPALI